MKDPVRCPPPLLGPPIRVSACVAQLRYRIPTTRYPGEPVPSLVSMYNVGYLFLSGSYAKNKARINCEMLPTLPVLSGLFFKAAQNGRLNRRV